MTTQIQFHNDIHTLEYSQHKTREEAITEVGNVFDAYKDILMDDKVTNVSLVMVYQTEGAQVAVERLSVATPSETNPNFNVFADGLVVEAVDKPQAVELYHRLADAMWIGITDDEENGPRYQEFEPCEDNSVIKLELKGK